MIKNKPTISAPSGRIPGYNAQHIACAPRTASYQFANISASIQLSVVPMGSTFYDILRQRFPTSVGGTATTRVIKNYLGAAINYPSTNSTMNFQCPSIVGIGNQFTGTLACIGMVSSSGNFNWFLSTNTNGNAGYSIYVTNVGVFSLKRGGGGQDSSIPTLVNIPFFYAASFNINLSVFNYIVRRLDNGQVFTDTKSPSGVQTSTSDQNFTVGNWGENPNFSINNPLAAVMATDAYLPMNALQYWANDPWSFWYPAEADPYSQVVGITAPVAFAGRRPLLGVGL